MLKLICPYEQNSSNIELGADATKQNNRRVVFQMVKSTLKNTPHCKLLQTLFNEKKKDFQENTIISKVHTERT